MKFLIFFFCVLNIWCFGQKEIKLDSTKIKSSNTIYFDDYDNIYLYQQDNLSLTKYNSSGKQIAQQMLPRPFRMQAINNPLNIVFFSENTQEIKLSDANLNDIQNINLPQNFGFIKSAFVEDLQTLWLLDDSTKKLIQYNYRTGKTINSFPYHINMEDIIDFLVYENKVYLLKKNNFEVLNFRGDILFKTNLHNPRFLKRENDRILIFSKTEMLEFSNKQNLKKFNFGEDSQIVDKNQSGFLVRSQNKLYLYQPESKNAHP